MAEQQPFVLHRQRWRGGRRRGGGTELQGKRGEEGNGALKVAVAVLALAQRAGLGKAAARVWLWWRCLPRRQRGRQLGKDGRGGERRRRRGEARRGVLNEARRGERRRWAPFGVGARTHARTQGRTHKPL